MKDIVAENPVSFMLLGPHRCLKIDTLATVAVASTPRSPIPELCKLPFEAWRRGERDSNRRVLQKSCRPPLVSHWQSIEPN